MSARSRVQVLDPHHSRVKQIDPASIFSTVRFLKSQPFGSFVNRRLAQSVPGGWLHSQPCWMKLILAGVLFHLIKDTFFIIINIICIIRNHHCNATEIMITMILMMTGMPAGFLLVRQLKRTSQNKSKCHLHYNKSICKQKWVFELLWKSIVNRN